MSSVITMVFGIAVGICIGYCAARDDDAEKNARLDEQSETIQKLTAKLLEKNDLEDDMK